MAKSITLAHLDALVDSSRLHRDLPRTLVEASAQGLRCRNWSELAAALQHLCPLEEAPVHPKRVDAARFGEERVVAFAEFEKLLSENGVFKDFESVPSNQLNQVGPKAHHMRRTGCTRTRATTHVHTAHLYTTLPTNGIDVRCPA